MVQHPKDKATLDTQRPLVLDDLPGDHMHSPASDEWWGRLRDLFEFPGRRQFVLNLGWKSL
jgi:hypothetical protein